MMDSGRSWRWSWHRRCWWSWWLRCWWRSWRLRWWWWSRWWGRWPWCWSRICAGCCRPVQFYQTPAGLLPSLVSLLCSSIILEKCWKVFLSSFLFSVEWSHPCALQEYCIIVIHLQHEHIVLSSYKLTSVRSAASKARNNFELQYKVPQHGK